MKVDLEKKYRTRAGLEVELHGIVLKNSAGKCVTFPVKGTVIRVKPSGRRMLENHIWMIDGAWSLFGEEDYDLVEVSDG